MDVLHLWSASHRLNWLEDASEIARVRRGTMLSRDNVVRRLVRSVTAEEFSSLEESRDEVVRAIEGPGDEAYVGGGS